MNTIDVIIPVYNGQDTISDSVNIVLKQCLPDGWKLHIIIVDDASTDKTGKIISEIFNEEVIAEKITIVTNKSNAGRACTRNVGAKRSSGAILCFLDCDCLFESDLVLQRYIELINSGFDCVFANIKSRKSNFTAHYINDIATRRFESADAGNYMEMTSASFAITNSAYSEIGGFCEDYVAYGFEDRDFIARLTANNINMTADKSCMVYHEDNIELSVISKKLIECAAYSAPVYFKNFPKYYRTSVYGKIDPRLSRLNINFIYSILVSILPFVLTPFQKALDARLIPYSFKKFLVKTVSFLSYIKGCQKQPVIDNVNFN